MTKPIRVEPKDCVGRVLSVGDPVVYPSRPYRGEVWLHHGKVAAVDGGKVRLEEQTAWRWCKLVVRIHQDSQPIGGN